MADRSNFWKIVDRTKPSKLRLFPESELRGCEKYFLEIQSDSTVPSTEIITASERLALTRSEIDLRHSDAKHRQTQRIARWALAFGMVSVAVAITSGVAQCVANKPTRETWPAAIEAPIVDTPAPRATNRYARAYCRATNRYARVHCRANTETNADRARSSKTPNSTRDQKRNRTS